MTRKRTKIPSPRERPFQWLLLLFSLFMLAFYAAGGQFPQQDVILYNRTESVPTGLYLHLSEEVPKRGDLVIFYPPEAIEKMAQERGYHKTRQRFLKRIAGLPGDTYRVEENGAFYVNDKYLGMITKADSKGRPMPELPVGEYTIPEGMFLPIGRASEEPGRPLYGACPH